MKDARTMKSNAQIFSKIIFILILFHGFSIAAAGQGILDFNYFEIDAGGEGRSAIGDLNGDGYNDVVLHTWGTNAGTNPDGYLAWYEYPYWTRSIIKGDDHFFGDAVIIEDIDSDGDNDIVTCKGNYSLAEVWLYENPGGEALYNWTEHFVGTVQTGSEVKDIEVHDIDGDGRADLVVRTQNKVAIYFQEASLTWTPRIMENGGREGMTIGDIDGDSDYDIILNGYWRENPSDPRTDEWLSYDIDDLWYTDFTNTWRDFSVMTDVADFDNDGKLDVVYSHSEKTGFYVTWYRTDNPKGGQTEWTKNELIVVDYCHTLIARDMDLDGNVDIVAANLKRSSNPEILVLKNLGSGSSWSAQTIDNSSAYKGTVGDIDNDGDYDFISSKSWEDAPLQLYRNTVTQNLPLDQWERILVDGALPNRALFIKSGDIDGDNISDLVAGGWWWKNPGTSSSAWQRNTIGSPLNNAALVHDFDKDGDLDVFGTEGVGSSSNNSLVWAENLGNGNFTIHTNIETTGSGDFPQGCEISDFGNGDRIILSWHNGGGGIHEVTVPDNPAVDTWSINRISTTTLSEDISIGDIDRDGDQDILLGTKWLKNNNGSWTPYTLGYIDDLDNDAETDRVDLADINGDKRLDAVIGLENGTYIVAFEAPSDPTQLWTRQIIGISPGEGFSMDVADFDRDGDPDVVVGEHKGTPENKVRIFENIDFGSQWTEILIDSDLSSVIDHHDGTQAVDLDKDGDRDIISVGWNNPKIWYYRNTAIDGGPAVSPPVPVINADRSIGIAPALIYFDGSASYSNSGTIVAYEWNFDDGHTASGISVSHLFESAGSYDVELSVTDNYGNSASAVYRINVIPNNSRITENLLLLYTFEEGSGNIINDVSRVGNQINLIINTPGEVTWTDHGLLINDESSINSIVPISKLILACQSTDEITIEAWIIPAAANIPTTQLPARIFTSSIDDLNRNFTLGQGLSGGASSLYDVRLRTSVTGSNGTQPSLFSPIGSLTPDTTHVVYTRAASGEARLYLDGSLVNSEQIGGSLSNWSNYPIYLGNEATGDRPWEGEFLLLSMYNRALSEIEVLQNFNYGEGGILSVAISAQPADQTALAGQSATFSIEAIGYGTLNYQWQRDGFDIPLATNSEYTIDNLELFDSGSLFGCIVSDDFGSVISDEAVLNVLETSPIILVQPEDQTVGLGENAVFSVDALGAGNVSYQWKKDNIDIQGATDETYVTPPTAPGDDGSLYQVLVIDGDANSVVSQEAILSISTLSSEVSVEESWNIVSVPLKTEDMSKTSLFPDAISSGFGFHNNRYTIVDSLVNGDGYWLKFNSPQSYQVLGQKISGPVSVTSGWNLVGPYNQQVPVDQIITDPANIILSSFYGFSRGYYASAILEPGKGYWVKILENGFLNIDEAVVSKSNSIGINNDNTDKLIIKDNANQQSVLYLISELDNTINLSLFELPPVPPAGIFDARFISGRNTEVLNDGSKRLVVKDAQYPLSISVEGDPVRLRDGYSGEIVDEVVESGGKILITDPQLKVFDISSAGEPEMPTKYELSQNYPNPFNPSTIITFDIPTSPQTPLPATAGKLTKERSRGEVVVRLKVYDILGNSVATLIDKPLAAGRYEVEFNAAGLASGVYFYRIEAGKFTDVKKMILLR